MDISRQTRIIYFNLITQQDKRPNNTHCSDIIMCKDESFNHFIFHNNTNNPPKKRNKSQKV